jgi:hypothetical protein
VTAGAIAGWALVVGCGQSSDQTDDAQRAAPGRESAEVRGDRGAPRLRTDRPDRLADHVVLISLDGLRPEFYLDERRPTPNLQQMRRDGAHAREVRSVFPSVTYPTHTTMITGAMPARHGVSYNEPFEPEGPTGRWYWEADSIRVPTLWEAVREAGGTTAAVSWPVSVEAPVDWLVPEVWPLDRAVDPIEPIRRLTRPEGLFEELEREATGRLTRDNFTNLHISRDDRVGAIGAYLLERYQPTLTAVHLISVDHFQHDEGREHDLVARALGAADRAIGQIREAAERAGILERTAFVITGDHGFLDVETLLAPNVWLVEAGLRAATRDRGEWRATFHASDGSAFLILRDEANWETEDLVRNLLETLSPEIKELFRVVERQELARIAADPRAPLALAAAPGAAFIGSADGPLLRPGSGATHGHFPDDYPEMFTGLVAWGAGVRGGATVQRIGTEDVAPLIAALLGLDFDAPDGELPEGVLVP